MCGRFALFLQAGAFADLFGCPPPADLEARYNIAPDSGIVVIRAGEGGRVAHRLRWGLLPPWADTPDDRGRQINARSETVFEKPSFKSAALRHRCLIPASGFFEWQKGSGPSRPHFIRRADGQPIAMAGIWRQSRFGDTTVLSTAILTMDAYPSISGIHHRMPVMLEPGAWDAWLDPASREPARLSQALRPLPEELIEAYPVSRSVNKPDNDSAALVTPAAASDEGAADEPAPAAPAQGALF